MICERCDGTQEQAMITQQRFDEAKAISAEARSLAREIDDCGGAHHAARLINRLAAVVEGMLVDELESR